MIVILRKKITMQWSSFVDGQNQFVGSNNHWLREGDRKGEKNTDAFVWFIVAPSKYFFLLNFPSIYLRIKFILYMRWGRETRRDDEKNRWKRIPQIFAHDDDIYDDSEYIFIVYENFFAYLALYHSCKYYFFFISCSIPLSVFYLY